MNSFRDTATRMELATTDYGRRCVNEKKKKKKPYTVRRVRFNNVKH